MKTSIVFTITNNYTDALRVFLYSYTLHNKYRPPCIIIEEESITVDNKNKIISIYPNTLFKEVQGNYIFERKFKRRKWTINPANRFDIFTLDCDRIIFFDADMIVCKSIEALFDMPVEFGAIYHPNPDGTHSKVLSPKSKFLKNKKFDYSRSFNAGVMIIDKKYLNRDVQNNLFEIYKSADWLGNQGPLNYYFNDKVTLLPSDYFVSTPHLTEANIISGKIFHFAGEKKPWLTKNNNIEDNFDSGIVTSSKDRLLLLKVLTKYKQALNKLND